MKNCPYCKQPIEGEITLPPMSERKVIIYRAVVKAGNRGVPAKELVKLIDSPGKGGGIVLRVQVHELNKVISSIQQRIKGSGGFYWLLSTEL